MWPGCSSVWGLPLRFYFVGFWLGVHRVRDPAVYSAQGSVGGSTKAQLGPVPSLSQLQKELLAVGQPPCACPPRAPGRQRGGGEAGDEQLSACGLPEPPRPGRAEASAEAGHDREMGPALPAPSTTVPKSPQIPGPPLPVPPQPCCCSIWPTGHPLLIESSGLPPTSVAAPSLPPMFLRACAGQLSPFPSSMPSILSGSRCFEDGSHILISGLA